MGNKMNINASIIDQRIIGIIRNHEDWLPEGDINKQKSAEFILLCMSTYLDLPIEEVVNLLTDDYNDVKLMVYISMILMMEIFLLLYFNENIG